MSNTIHKIQSIAGITYWTSNSCLRRYLCSDFTSQTGQTDLIIKHLDIPMTWLYEQSLKGTYVTMFTPTARNKSDMNTKPNEGSNQQKMNMAIVGYQHYPPEGL